MSGVVADRGDEAVPTGPHWVVVNLSRGKYEGPIEIGKGWRRLYRHPSEALAIAECERLALAQPGNRFAVYASGHTRKVARVQVPGEPGAIPPIGEDVPS